MGIDVVPPGCTHQKSLDGFLLFGKAEAHKHGRCAPRPQAPAHLSRRPRAHRTGRLCPCHPPQADASPSRYQSSVMDPRLDLRQAVAYQRRAGYWEHCSVQMDYHHNKLVGIVVTI